MKDSVVFGRVRFVTVHLFDECSARSVYAENVETPTFFRAWKKNLNFNKRFDYIFDFQ